MRCLKNVFIIFIVLISMQGCIPYAIEIENLDEVNIDDVKNLEIVGMSTEQLIDQFGPPLAVARKDGPPLYFPKLFKNTSIRYDAWHVLKKFTPKHTITDDHTVYCYQQSITSGGGLIIAAASTSGGGAVPLLSTTDTIYTLWLLIDERTQKVIDVMVEKQNEKK